MAESRGLGDVYKRQMHHFTTAFADSAIPLIREAITPFLNGETVQQQPPETATSTSTTKAGPAPSTPAAPTPANPVPYPAFPAGEAI